MANVISSNFRVSRVVMKHFSRSEVTNRAQSLVNKLIMAQSSDSIRLRAQELCKHFVEYPATRVIAVQVSQLRVTCNFLIPLVRCFSGLQYIAAQYLFESTLLLFSFSF